MKCRHLVLTALALSSAGWDTTGHYEEGDRQWTSMFDGAFDEDLVDLWGVGQVNTEYLTGNEHAEIGHIALQQLGWRDMLYGEPMPTMLDLNASVWHTEASSPLLVGTFDDGDVAATPLIERTLPHPARWAGVADFSYTAYDWINRNVLCPAVPADEPTVGQCHEYKAWLGAALNSSHFGEQPVRMYRRLHAIALTLAANAGAMHAALAAADIEADRVSLERMVREAELWALAFEGYAQHFLADRWSSGHMWTRYGSPEYQGPDTLLRSMAVGGFSGLIHGAEAVLKEYGAPESWVPDALCSPSVVEEGFDTLLPARFVGPGFDHVPAIGDYRLEDAFDGAFGADHGYDDLELDVGLQMESMMTCSRAGWADVARGFGANPDGTVGVLGLPIDGAATFDAAVANATQDGDTISCFETWATNASMVYAVNDPTKTTMWVALNAAAAGSMHWKADVAGRLAGLDLPDVGKTFFQIQAYGLLHPTQTDLADGTALPSLMGVGGGSTFLSQVPPSYTEPAGGGDDPFAALPMHTDEWDYPAVGDRPGRDRHTLHGFANGAHAAAWCEAGYEVLEYDDAYPFDDTEQGLRWPVPMPNGGGNQPSDEETVTLNKRLDACALLADRLFDRTYAWYRGEVYLGPQREFRRAGHGDQNALVVRSTCDVFGAQPALWDDSPIQLHPGYVAEGAAYATQDFYGDRVYESILNWCRAIPVVHVDDNDVAVDATGAPIAVHPGFTDAGALSFAPSVQDPEVTLYGANFGETAGQVQLDSERGCVTDPPVSHFADIVSWTDTAITIRVPHTRFIPDHYKITILRPDRDMDGIRIRSVGRARLDVQRAAFSGVGDTPPPLPTDITGQLFAAVHPFCAGSTVTQHRVHDCTGVDEATCGADGGPGTLLWSNGSPAGYQPGPYSAHQWGVMQTGVCSSLPVWVNCLPQYPSGSGTYGMIYRFERTSTASTTETPKRWRWTLVWQRPGPF